MYRHAITRSAAVVGGGVVAMLMAISPAMAGPTTVDGIATHVVTDSEMAPAGSTGQAEASCGAGELLVGGGYVINDTSTGWRMYVDAPLDSSTWLAEVVNFDTTQPLSFSAYAICAQGAIKGYTTQVVQAQVVAPAVQTSEAQATCPSGELRTGGGYDVYNVSPNWSVYGSGPLNSDTWNVEIDNEVPVTTTFDSFAVCLAKTNSKPVTKLQVGTVDTAAGVPANPGQTADVSCGPASLMTGGGHEIDSVGLNWTIQASAPVSANDWQVLVSDLDNVSRVFDSFAVCLSSAP